jgi:cytochrome b561
MLLFRLHKIALALLPLTAASLLLTALGSGMVVLTLLTESEAQSPLLRVAILFTLWNLMVFAFVRLFQVIPPPVLPHMGWVEKAWLRCKHGFYYVLAFAVIATGTGLLGLSMKLLML